MGTPSKPWFPEHSPEIKEALKTRHTLGASNTADHHRLGTPGVNHHNTTVAVTLGFERSEDRTGIPRRHKTRLVLDIWEDYEILAAQIAAILYERFPEDTAELLPLPTLMVPDRFSGQRQLLDPITPLRQLTRLKNQVVNPAIIAVMPDKVVSSYVLVDRYMAMASDEYP